MFAINLDISDVVFEDGWDINLYMPALIQVFLFGYSTSAKVAAAAPLHIQMNDHAKVGNLTSGNVPFEKTLS